jgi:hypothetical protein
VPVNRLKQGDVYQRHSASVVTRVRVPGDSRRMPQTAASGLGRLRAELATIAGSGYAQALHRCLSRWEVREIADEGKNRVWPGLNRQPVTLVSLEEFVRRWSSVGVDFKFASLSWKQGLSLLGFYAKKLDGPGKRPLIFVNTAHHPAIVGAALDHEMGHHLTSRIFGQRNQATHPLSLTGFIEHLSEPAELAADTLVSLGIFPAAIARKLFRGPAQEGEELPAAIVNQVSPYIADRYDLHLEQIRGAQKKLHALAALVHYTNLRRALLDEYDI